MYNSLAKKVFAVGLAASTALMAMAPFAHAAAHSAGTNIKSSDGTVWMVTSDGYRRAYTSAGAFLSYGFNSWANVVAANSDDLALPAGSFIPPQDGKVICSDRGTDKGTCYLVTNGQKGGFTSASVFTGLGFSFSRSTSGDVSWMGSTSNIDNTTMAHRPGVLVNDNGTVKLVGNSGVLGIPDLATFNSWGYSFADVVPANAADKAMSMTGVMAARIAGQLSPVASTGTTPPPSGSGVAVTLASNTPVAGTIASGTAHNPVLALNFTAGSSGAASITGITVTKGGYLANTSVSGVSVYDSTGRRHGNEVTTLGANGTATLTFSNDPIVVAAGQTATVWIKANISSSVTSGTLSMGVNSASDVMVSGGTVTGSFPVMGNTMTLVSGSSNIATAKVDEMPVNTSGITLNVDPATEQQIAKFRLQETTSNEGIKLYSLTLWNNGNAAATDYKDVQLQDPSGTVIATAQPNGQVVYFDLSNSPYFVDKGQTKDLSVWAKIVSGTTRTIQFTIYNDYDVDVRGAQTGAGLLPTAIATYDSTFPIGDSTSSYNKVTVGSGTLTLTKDTASPSTSVVPGAGSVELGRFDVKSTGEDMEIRGITFGIATGSGGSTNMTGTVYVKVDGNIVYSAAYNTTNFPAAGSATARTLSSYPVIKAGVQSVITVVGDISSNATASDTFQVTNMDVTSVKRLVSNDIVDPGVSVQSGNTISVRAGSLVVTTLGTPVATSYVATTPNVPLASFELNAQGSGEDVRVSSIKVTDTTTGAATTSDVTNLTLFASNGSQVQTASGNNTLTAGATTGTVTFTLSQPIIVSKTTPVVLTMKGDVIGGTSGTHTFAIAVAADVVATGKDTGNSITPSTPVGSGQAMTLTNKGTLTASLVTGSNATPALAQVVNVGSTGQTFLAFTLNAQFEAEKITSLTIHATGTQLNNGTIKNIALYRQVGTGSVDATPFKTASQFSNCSSNACSYTWTDGDNVLPAAINPGAPVTIYVKADIAPAGAAYLGDNFYMGINATSGIDITGKGVTSATAPTYTAADLNNGTSNKSYVVPFGVVVTGDYPTTGSSNLSSVGANTVIGRFKITNNGSAQVTVTDASFADSGSNSTTADRYSLFVSSQNSNDYTTNTATSAASSVAFGTLTNSFTLDGGAYRFLTVEITAGTAGLSSGDSFQLAVTALGNLKYSVTEASLGYDGKQNGNLSDTVTGLYVDGKPSLGTIQKQ